MSNHDDPTRTPRMTHAVGKFAHVANTNEDETISHHITPFSTYVKVALALFALTFLTVGAHALRHYIEPFSAIVAFAIAGVKAYLVMAWFMHLKYDTLMNKIIFSLGFIFLALLFALSALDIYTRVFQGNIL